MKNFKTFSARHRLAPPSLFFAGLKQIKKGKRSAKIFVKKFKEYCFYLKRVYQNNHFAGNRASRVLRRLFEIKNIKEFLGLNLAGFLIFSQVLNKPLPAALAKYQVPNLAQASNQIETTTVISTACPLTSFNISQGYYLFHRGIDLKETKNTPVHPIMDGTVKEVIFSNFSYGNHLIIDHGSGYQSLYAHLGSVLVKKGEKVSKNTTIGTIGTSGWSTGPHLHLEIREGNATINPLEILK